MKKPEMIYLFVIVILIWIGIPLAVMQVYSSMEQSSQFADIFNISNSLFSVLGFLAVIYTIIIQQNNFQNEINTVNKTNKLNYLTSLLNYYSSEEEKYATLDQKKSTFSKEKKESILSLIEKEVNNV